MNSKSLSIALVLLLAVMFGTFMVLVQKPWQAYGSTVVGNDYMATSTQTQTEYPNLRNALQSDFRPGYGTTTPGVLGSVIITTLGTSPFCLYDATSTATNAENTKGTTTIACFGASAPAGTYTFDVAVEKGVVVHFTGSVSATARASTTITFRK